MENLICDLCEEREATFKIDLPQFMGLKVIDRPQICQYCLELIKHQLEAPIVRGTDIPGGAIVYPQECLICGVVSHYDYSNRRFEPLLYELNTDTGFESICVNCCESFLNVHKAASPLPSKKDR